MKSVLQKLETASSVVIAVVAIVVGGIVVTREFRTPSAVGRSQLDGAAQANSAVRFVEDWKQIAEIGIDLGDTAASVRVVVFTDLECPACRRFERTMGQMSSTFGDSLAVTLVHFPLPSHRFSRKSAHALECADQQGRAVAFKDAVFSGQDSIGLRTFTAYARSAGIEDTSEFARCLNQSEMPPRIEAGLAAGERIGLRGTPTVMINGWVFGSVPSAAALEATIRDLLAGRRPTQSHQP